jgi:hypothetical protein
MTPAFERPPPDKETARPAAERAAQSYQENDNSAENTHAGYGAQAGEARI